ncbi:MAG: 3-phosphoglycerate dehydrogenase family protein [Clostridia bacterium]|nr:3-phosphoglycerate dehydrogenase family protein [Clostridia bacterium]MEE0180641.1 3-phosphoglycerate dehydrogenase family protein [Anaerovoracaceae bacterium]
MFKIATLNKISPVGLSHLTDNYTITENVDEANAILVRSQAMHDMDFSDNLLSIARAGAGVNNIPLDRCAEEGIVVFNTPGANANAVKELVLAGMFMAARNIPEAVIWAKSLDSDVLKAYEKGKGQFAGTEIAGKTLGVIGLGAIGIKIANAAEALGMNVIGYDPFLTVNAAHRISNTAEIVNDMKDMLGKCDYITIHVPATDSTKGMMNKEVFDRMKDGTIFLNFSRDKLVNDADLMAAIDSGKIRKYVTDFATDELLHYNNVIAIPHLGASSAEAEDNCATMAALQTMDYIENGNIVNSVNFPAVSLGAKTGTRIAVLSKANDTIISDVTAALNAKNAVISNIISKTKGNFAYTLVETPAAVDSLEIANDSVIRVRII